MRSPLENFAEHDALRRCENQLFALARRLVVFRRLNEGPRDGLPPLAVAGFFMLRHRVTIARVVTQPTVRSG